MQLGRQGVGDLVRSPSSCSAPPPLLFVQTLTVDISESSNLQSPGGLHTSLAAIIPKTKRDRQADYLGLYFFFSWEQRKTLNALAAREELMGQSPKCSFISPNAVGPHFSSLVLPCHSCSAAKLQGEVLPQGWAPLGLPCSPLSVSGHRAPGAGTARNKLMLSPTLYSPSLYLVVPFPGWSSDGLPWSHPARFRGCSPPRLAPCRDGTATARGSSPPYGAPGRLPAPGAVVGTTQNPIVGARRAFLRGQGPVPAPSTAGQMAQPGRTRPPPPLAACRGCSPCAVSPCCPLHLVPSRAAPLLTALLGGLCRQTAEVLMVLCPALNYFPDCHRHVLASGAGCDPAGADAAAAAWGADGRSTPHVEFNYWLSSLTEYIG